MNKFIERTENATRFQGELNLLGAQAMHREKTNIPISTGLIDFQNNVTSKKFKNSLFFSGDRISLDLKKNLALFYIFLISCVGSSVLAMLIYNSQDSFTGLEIALFTSGVSLLAVSCVVLYLIASQPRVTHYYREILVLLTALATLYLSLTGRNVLSELSYKAHEYSPEFNSLSIVCLLSILKISVFNSYKLFCVSCISCGVLHISIISAFASDSHLVLLESSRLGLFLVLLMFETHLVDIRTKYLFYKQVQEEQFEPSLSKNTSSQQANTAIEIIVNSIDSIKSYLKDTINIVISRDIKQGLITAFKELEGIKRKIVHDPEFSKMVLDENWNLDEEERLYVEDYVQQGPVSGRPEVRRPTIQKLIETLHLTRMNSYETLRVEKILDQLGSTWNFNVWDLQSVAGSTLQLAAGHLLDKFNIKSEFNLDNTTVYNYFTAMEQNYIANPYHNAAHATDVLNSLLYFIQQSFLMSSLNSLEIFAVIISALAHDVGHPGTTNRYIAANREPLALRYNDSSVLENMHAALTFELMCPQHHNILEHLNLDEWQRVRQLIIGMILGTDITKHFELLGKFRTRAVLLHDLTMTNLDDLSFVLAIGLKAADIGHSAKDIALHKRWTDFVTEEFFLQGDRERAKGQPISANCDKFSTNVAKSQVGFLRAVVVPLYESWCAYLEESAITMNCLEQAQSNVEYWDEQSAERKTNSEDTSFMVSAREKQ